MTLERVQQWRDYDDRYYFTPARRVHNTCCGEHLIRKVKKAVLHIVGFVVGNENELVFSTAISY